MAFVSLGVMGLAGYSVYERLSLHFSGDSLEVRPSPVPLPKEDAAAEKAAPAAPAPEAETKPATAPAAPEAAQEKVKAVKKVFEYKDAKARSVSIAGSFSSWKEVAMAKKSGVWKIEIYILPGTYPYHFTVDGKKKLDPGKPKAPTGDSLVNVVSLN